MTSPFLEQQKRERGREDQTSFSPQGPAKPWLRRNWWKLFFIPVVFQVLMWLGATAFLSHSLPFLKHGSFKFIFSGALANVPEDFPKTFIPPGFAVQQVVQQNEQITVMGEGDESVSELSTWLREEAHDADWLVATQMASPQGMLIVLTQGAKRLEIVINAQSEGRSQMIYTLHEVKT